MLIALPNRTWYMTDTHEPHFAVLRTERVLPKQALFKIEKIADVFAACAIDMLEPKRMADRKDNELPKPVESSILTLAATLPAARNDSAEPNAQ
jgi:hypothetical protein